MGRSVVIKIGMWSAALAVMWWMGWPMMDPPPATPDRESPVPRAASSTVPLDRKAGPVPGTRVNVNAGTPEELESLPGIGPVLAKRIVAYRVQHGIFASVHELTNVRGIGTGRLTQLLPLIRLK